METKVYIGTSGYSYNDWKGEVYPEKTRASEYFDRYSRIFLFSELNYSYYTMPTARTLSALVHKSPNGFLFSIKAHKTLTHEIDAAWRDRVKQFTGEIAPLIEADKLATILFQFPFSFHYTGENRNYLDALASALSGFPAHIEFRNAEWNRDSVLAGLRERNLGYVAVDNPELKGLPEFIPDVTNGIAYARFHGKNNLNWWSGTHTTRYDYLYTEAELSEKLPLLLKMAGEGKLLLVAFNNHYKGKAVKNGRELVKKMTGLPGLQLMLPDTQEGVIS